MIGSAASSTNTTTLLDHRTAPPSRCNRIQNLTTLRSGPSTPDRLQTVSIVECLETGAITRFRHCSPVPRLLSLAHHDGIRCTRPRAADWWCPGDDRGEILGDEPIIGHVRDFATGKDAAVI